MAPEYPISASAAAEPAASEAAEAIERYDIAAARQQLTETCAGTDEIYRLVSSVRLDDPESILTFGARAAEGISRASDTILHTVSMDSANDSGELLTSLAGIMQKFDLNEIRGSVSPFSRLFGGAGRQLDRILDKYHTMGDEVDRIYGQLSRYSDELRRSGRALEDLFSANVEYYNELVKYILAGEQAVREIEAYTEQRRRDMEATGDRSIQFEIQRLMQVQTLMEQRTQDLRTAEIVAMQTIAMIQTMEANNLNLTRKIHSAFIVTLPVFKQALAQAIFLKRQRIQAEAVSALDKNTSEMLRRNAKNMARVSAETARTVSGETSHTDALQDAWKTIVKGIDETKAIQSEAQEKRRQDRQRLESIRRDFESRRRA